MRVQAKWEDWRSCNSIRESHASWVVQMSATAIEIESLPAGYSEGSRHALDYGKSHPVERATSQGEECDSSMRSADSRSQRVAELFAFTAMGGSEEIAAGARVAMR